MTSASPELRNRSLGADYCLGKRMLSIKLDLGYSDIRASRFILKVL